MCWRGFLEDRLLDPAAIERIGATGMKAAPRGNLDGTRHVTGENNAFPLDGGVRHRNGCEQRLGVRVQWIAEELTGRRDLDDPAEIHHGNPMADVLDHGEIVRDKQIRQAEFALQIGEQVDDLRLHRDIERRDRLVADDQLRPWRQRPRDAEALPLSAREFVRVLGHLFGSQADFLEKRAHPLVDLRRSALLEIVNRLGDDIRRAHARVERCIRVLEHGLHFATKRPHGSGRELIDALAPP